MISLKQILLKEYSDKVIQNTIERWKKEKSDIDDKQARAVINRFDQVKSGLSSKLDILNLSNELRQGQNYLNIDKYSLSDMVNLLRSIPEKEDKVKKEAAKKFSEETGIPEAATRSYVARFFSNKSNLQLAAKEGNDQFSKEEVLNFIPKQLQRGDMFLDPRNWRWEQFEQMLDAIYPSQKQSEDGNENYATTDADKVYDKDGIEIYKGDDINKCISYSPKLDTTGRKKYGWCVSQVGNTNYDYYRFEERSPTFYFVFDRNKPSTPEHSRFDDKWHAFVVQVNKVQNEESYRITSADNDSDTKAKSWEDIQKIVPSDIWSKIKGLKDYFKPIDLSAVERGRKFASGKSLSLDEFKELNTEEKILYIQGKASKNQISNEILQILPKFKIPLEGRSTTLANVAIDSGQKFPYSVLKNNEALAKRYAIFRFRHTDYAKDAIPLPYIQYLDDAAKEKYLEIYDDNLNFDYVKRYFGENTLKIYTNNKAKNFDLITPEYIKYIDDPKLQTIYGIYNKLIKNWQFSDTFGLSEEQLENIQDSPEQDVDPKPIYIKDWNKFTPEEQKAIIKLAEQTNGKEKYITLIYALPYIIKEGSEYFFLLPENEYYENWSLINQSGKIIKKYSGEDELIEGEPLISGYPNYQEPKKIYNIEDTLLGNNLNEGKYSFIAEIKINQPLSLIEKTIKLYDKLYKAPEDGYDGNLKEWIENNIIPPYDKYWNIPERHIHDVFKDLPLLELKRLYDFLKTYNQENYLREQYIKERLKNRAGIK